MLRPYVYDDKTPFHAPKTLPLGAHWRSVMPILRRPDLRAQHYIKTKESSRGANGAVCPTRDPHGSEKRLSPGEPFQRPVARERRLSQPHAQQPVKSECRAQNKGQNHDPANQNCTRLAGVLAD